MKSTWVVLLSAVALSFADAQVQTSQRYDTAHFSVQYPPNAQIILRDERDSGVDSITHDYHGRLPRHCWVDVTITEFSGVVLAKDHTENMFSKGTIKMFAPGFQASPITKATLGGLQGFKQTIHGQVAGGSGLPLVVHWRLAVSSDRTHVWALKTTSPTDEDLPESVCERFFDSLKIK